MIILRDSSSLPAALKGCVVALGNFDGLHLGHAAVIGEAVRIAREKGVPAAAMTFEPHPRQVFAPDLPPLRILPLHEKLRLLKEMKIDFLRVVRFTKAFSQTPPQDFVTHRLHQEMRASHIVTGEDFAFGHNRGGNAQMLKAMAAKLGINATSCGAVMVEGTRCSSTRIRETLGQGDMAAVSALLGRPYRITGRVRQGDKRGRQLGFPTANILPSPIFLPAYGIYAVKAQLRGSQVQGVASLGIRPNYPLARPLLEVHLFDWQEAIYGERAEVQLLHYLRPERKFDDAKALAAQIEADCAAARSLFT